MSGLALANLILIAAPIALLATILGPIWLWFVSAPLAATALVIALVRLHQALRDDA